MTSPIERLRTMNSRYRGRRENRNARANRSRGLVLAATTAAIVAAADARSTPDGAIRLAGCVLLPYLAVRTILPAADGAAQPG
jgi:hypothetical protein